VAVNQSLVGYTRLTLDQLVIIGISKCPQISTSFYENAYIEKLMANE